MKKLLRRKLRRMLNSLFATFGKAFVINTLLELIAEIGDWNSEQ
jgi:hypothetical protein